jgi:hypothetical protein
MILGLFIFAFCTWAVFSKHFCDGIITKHLLVFAAITAMLTILDPANVVAGVSSILLLFSGMAYWGCKHRVEIMAYLHTRAE